MGLDAKSDGKGKSNPNGLKGDLDDVRWYEEKKSEKERVTEKKKVKRKKKQREVGRK